MTLREAAQRVLEALIKPIHEQPFGLKQNAITALRAALAQQEREPVAYLYSTISGTVVLHRVKRIGHAKPLYLQAQLENDTKGAQEYPNAHSITPLFTHPPRREWVSLTEDENNELSRTMVKGHKSVNWLTRAIEQALKERNT